MRVSGGEDRDFVGAPQQPEGEEVAHLKGEEGRGKN